MVRQLVVIDTASMTLTAYETIEIQRHDKKNGGWIFEASTSRMAQAKLTLDEDTTIEGLKTVIEGFRRNPEPEDTSKVVSLPRRVLDRSKAIIQVGKSPDKTVTNTSSLTPSPTDVSKNPYFDPYMVILSPIYFNFDGLPKNGEVQKLLDELDESPKDPT